MSILALLLLAPLAAAKPLAEADPDPFPGQISATSNLEKKTYPNNLEDIVKQIRQEDTDRIHGSSPVPWVKAVFVGFDPFESDRGPDVWGTMADVKERNEREEREKEEDGDGFELPVDEADDEPETDEDEEEDGTCKQSDRNDKRCGEDPLETYFVCMRDHSVSWEKRYMWREFSVRTGFKCVEDEEVEGKIKWERVDEDEQNND